MSALARDEDVFDGIDVTDGEIAICTSIETLLGWRDDIDAAIDDIRGQIDVAAAGGIAEPQWVYRASKANGYYRRSRSRIENRLERIGWIEPAKRGDVVELKAKLAHSKALSEVAVEFLRICLHGGMADREEFARLETLAIEAVEARKRKKGIARASGEA
jgi:hypothetical protein